jgi:ubiquinone/menaquinone biosynthesis C-methylase UbiE
MISVNHDERARQQFALAMNRYVQTTLAEGSRRLCEGKVAPELGITSVLDGHERQRLRRQMENEPLHQFWLAMMQVWQDLLWRYTGECVDRQLDELVARCRPKAGDCGTLRLNPDLELPRYQAAVDNHSLPGGYHAETCSDDVRQGAIYAHSATLYLLGQTGAKHDYRGQTLIAHVLSRFPGFEPRDIVDLGCLVGASTFAYAEQFPQARLCAVDTSAPGLRFAHGLAESRNLAVHFSQQDAESLDFPEQSFDLVVSHALLHETSRSAVRNIFGECLRMLRPGGIMAHIEVPARIEVMSPWDYLRSSYEGFYNQEPFWNGLTETDLAQIADEVGFASVVQGFQKTASSGRAKLPPDAFVPVGKGRLDLSNWFVVSAR